MSFRLPLITKTLILLFALTTQAQAISCNGANMWTTLPQSTKQKLIAAANKQPFATGRFFKIERNGKVSYVLGTIHVPPIKQLALPEHVMAKVRASKRVYLEKSRKEFDAFEKMVKKNPGYIRAGGLNGFSKYFNNQQWSAIRSALVIAGWRKGAAETLNPWVILDEIEGIGCGSDWEGFKRSLDVRIMRTAENRKIPTIGLETPEKVDRYYQALSTRDLVDMLKALPIQKRDYPYGPAGKAALSLLASENIVLAQVFSDYVDQQLPNPRGVRLLAEFRDQKILYARNKAWMPTLTKALNAGGTFVAVGAAHLGGRYGILPMLQRQGFKITRIPLK